MVNFKRLARNIASAIKIKNVVPIYKVVPQNREFNGKVALITGGTGGIGKEVAKVLLESGCNVIIAGSKNESVSATLDEIKNDHAKGIVIDFSRINEFKDKIESAISLFGKIDIYINCVGVHTNNANFWNITENEYSRVMNLNLKSEFFMCQAIAKYMKEHNINGNILLVSSTRGFEPAWSPYGISKWGSNGLIKGLAKILAPFGITVNGIAPGTTATSLVGAEKGKTIYTEENMSGRYIMPLEVAQLAKYLVSPACKMINGEIITISGGRGTFDIR